MLSDRSTHRSLTVPAALRSPAIAVKPSGLPPTGATAKLVATRGGASRAWPPAFLYATPGRTAHEPGPTPASSGSPIGSNGAPGHGSVLAALSGLASP